VTRARIVVWALAAVFVIAASRQIAYALAGAAVAQRLAGDGGGTAPVWIAVGALAACAALACVGTWLVAIGVRERCRLELECWAAPAPLQPACVAARAAALALATNAGFALVESCIHYHEGFGWMGLRCIEGPIHVDAAPILVGLSLVAAALVTAAEHVLRALRRAAARQVIGRRGAPRAAARPRRTPAGRLAVRRIATGANLTRGPPAGVCPA
jgi:hypothetical protein